MHDIQIDWAWTVLPMLDMVNVVGAVEQARQTARAHETIASIGDVR